MNIHITFKHLKAGNKFMKITNNHIKYCVQDQQKTYRLPKFIWDRL